ncbi:hypothetical protein C8R47DRAFT_111514 [Mycena vitilis]|nr:hypothetical protein C8R47DRAFT_111514 [Mycena vitilis]
MLFIGGTAMESKSLKGNFKLDFVDKKLRKQMPAACEHCRKEETDPKSQKMQICVRCKNIGRTMPYCSRQCVKDDWARHRLVCGKPFTEETAVSTAVVVNPATGLGCAPTIIPSFMPSMRASRQCSIRPCTGGYKRSAALIRQVLLLQQNPSVDYFLCLPTIKDNLLPLVIRDDTMSAHLCAARDEVISSGDFDSLGRLASILEQATRKWIAAGQYREEYLVAQIRREYDVALEISPFDG